jgi:general L-amino acid transport system substrate-binding protein
MSRGIRTLMAVSAALLLVASACSDDDDDDAADTTPVAAEETTAPAEVETTTGGTLAEVQERGTLNCGTNGQLAGFSLNENGVYSGFDVDFCRAIAAAILGDPEAVTYIDLTADTRFTALQSGEIDVLIRNGTWTASRDGGLGLQWSTTTFYDGQGMLVRTDSEFETLADMQNTVICVQSGTTTELNLASVFANEGITYEPLLLPDEEAIASSFNEGACDGYTTDKSGLASFRATFPEGPDAVRIMDETMSKEPLGPAVRQGDDEWFDIVNWVTLATIQAEEFGLTSENIGTAATEFADNPEVLRFIGAGTGDDAEFDAGLNLPPDFAVLVVQAVGNYGEIYERNITPLGLERGLNNLWNAEEPGLLYSPPYR